MITIETWDSLYDKQQGYFEELKARYWPQLSAEDQQLISFEHFEHPTLFQKIKTIGRTQSALGMLSEIGPLSTEERAKITMLLMVMIGLLRRSSSEEAAEIRDLELAARICQRFNMLPEAAITKLESGISIDE